MNTWQFDYSRSRSFIDCCPRSLSFNIFQLNGVSMGCGEWKFVQILQVTCPCPYMLKTSKIFFFRNQEADDLETLYTLSGVWLSPFVFKWWLCWPLLFLWQDQICFLMLLYGWQFLQHWVLMYFQVCSNSAYSQNWGERCRTNGPLVSWVVPNESCREKIWLRS